MGISKLPLFNSLPQAPEIHLGLTEGRERGVSRTASFHHTLQLSVVLPHLTILPTNKEIVAWIYD